VQAFCIHLVILVTLVCLVVATVSAASAALLSCRVCCLYHCIYHLLLANKVMMMMKCPVSRGGSLRQHSLLVYVLCCIRKFH